MGHTIAFFLFEDAEELDWAGPWEVLSAWAQGWPVERAREVRRYIQYDPEPPV